MRTNFILKEDIRRTYIMYCRERGRIHAFLGTLRSPGVHAVVAFRFANWLMRQSLGIKILLKIPQILLGDLVKILWGIYIGETAKIGKGLFIGHFGGIIVSGKAVIGEYTNIQQGVTIGVSGQEEKRGDPCIGDHVFIGPGAKVLGKIKVGNHVKIGANTVVTKDIPDNAIVVLPGRGFEIISYNGNKNYV